MDSRLGMSEARLQDAVTEAAETFGWLPYHTRNSKGSQAGFPDLVLVRERVIFIELKSHTGILTREQRYWADCLRHAKAEYYEWRPADWINGPILDVLR